MSVLASIYEKAGSPGVGRSLTLLPDLTQASGGWQEPDPSSGLSNNTSDFRIIIMAIEGDWNLNGDMSMARQPCAPCHSRLTGGIRRNLVRGAVNPSLPTARTHYTRPCEITFSSRYIKHSVSFWLHPILGRNHRDMTKETKTDVESRPNRLETR